jgi:hypothetical protein
MPLGVKKAIKRAALFLLIPTARCVLVIAGDGIVRAVGQLQDASVCVDPATRAP